jgi:hypothetical protein
VRGRYDASAPRKLLVEWDEVDVLPLLRFEEEEKNHSQPLVPLMGGLKERDVGVKSRGCTISDLTSGGDNWRIGKWSCGGLHFVFLRWREDREETVTFEEWCCCTDGDMVRRMRR